MGQKVLIDLQYLPSLEYFTVLQLHKDIEIEVCENFVKQSYRNRAYILAANKVTQLTIPVIGGNSKQSIRSIEVDHNQRWVDIHWRGIISAYGKAPYFEYYADYFEQILSKKHSHLFELNMELLTLCLKLLQSDNTITFSEKYRKDPEDGILDLRSVIHPKKDFGQRPYYQPYSYIQLFGKEFVPNLSIIDVLFCEGPNAGNIIHRSSVTP
jgi:hypothetical protein